MKKWLLFLGLAVFVMGPAFLGAGTPADEGQQAATPTPEPTPTPSVEEELSKERRQNERAILEQINEIRSERGLQTLSMAAEQRALARNHSEDMVRDHYYDHTAPDGTRFMPSCRPTGEVLMKAEASLYDHQRVAEIVTEAWMESDEHREIMLDPRYTTIGVGVRMLWGGPQYVTVNFC